MSLSSLFQGVQLGKEPTPGGLTAANRVLQSISIQPGMQANIKMFRAAGRKFNAVSALGKEWGSARISGQPTFDEMEYILASILCMVTPTGAGTAKTWTHAPAMSAADSYATYTLEQGDGDRAHRFTYSTVTDAQLSGDRDSVNLGGSMIMRQVEDGVTMTAAPTAVPLVPITGDMFNLYLADSAAGLTGATALVNPLNWKFSVGNRYGPYWPLNRGQASFKGLIEKVPTVTAGLLMAADAEGMGLVTTMRANATKFLRIQAQGPQIGAGPDKYLLQLDMAVKVTSPSEWKDQDGVFAYEWGFTVVEDATWGKALEAKLVNTLSAL